MTFDRQHLLADLEELGATHRLAFAASCCTRLLSPYKTFYEVKRCRNYDLLAKTVGLIWDALEDQQLPRERFEHLHEEIEADVPQENDECFSSPFFATTQYAYFGILAALRCATYGSEDDAAWTGNAAAEAIRSYLEEVKEVRREAIDAHPMMQRELSRQREDIAALKEQKCLSSALLMRLRYSAEQNRAEK
jgi:uncharacterized protein YjaG (DUF416 family)